MFQFDHPMFKPLWVRIAIVGVTGTWAVFEFMMGELVWGSIFGAIAAVAFYGLFLNYPPSDSDTDNKAE